MKVISFCLWGDDEKYTTGLLENLKLCKIYYKDFIPWIYVHHTVDSEFLKKLQQYDVKIIHVYTKLNPNILMSQRFLPIDDKNVELFISRDVDTRILPREVLAVNEWILSDKKLHIMRDSPFHREKIMGGMFGIKNPFNINMKSIIDLYFSKFPNNNDQHLLRDIVYKKLYDDDDYILHTDIVTYPDEHSIPFPIHWDDDYHFVGEWIYADGSQNSYHVNVLKTKVQEMKNNINK